MPEGYVSARPYPGKRYRLKHAAQEGQLVTLRCGLCHRAVTYLASDLVELVNPEQDVHIPPFQCGKCGKLDYLQVTLRMPAAGDYGNLTIRRPGPVRRTQTWKTCKLGDEVKR